MLFCVQDEEKLLQNSAKPTDEQEQLYYALLQQNLPNNPAVIIHLSLYSCDVI